MVNDKTSWFPCKSPIYCTQTPSPNTIVSRECLASEIYSLEELHCCSKGCRWKQVTQTLICSKIQRCPSSNKVTLMVVCNDDQGLSLWSVVRRGPPAFTRGWRTALRMWSALYKNKSGCHAKFMPCSDTSGDEFTSFFLTRCLVYWWIWSTSLENLFIFWNKVFWKWIWLIFLFQCIRYKCTLQVYCLS